MLDFIPVSDPKDDPVYNAQEVPKEFDIFYRAESSFLPPGKIFSDLTPEELRLLQNQYRFDPLRPGMYQCISGMSGTGRGGM